MDVVIDGLDSMNARYAINRACIDLEVPYVFGAAVATTGNLSTIIPKKTPCLECFYGYLDDNKLPKCGLFMSTDVLFSPRRYEHIAGSLKYNLGLFIIRFPIFL